MSDEEIFKQIADEVESLAVEYATADAATQNNILRSWHARVIDRYGAKYKSFANAILMIASTRKQEIYMGDNITQNFSGGNFTGPVAAKMENCTSIINQQNNGDRRDLLKTIQREVQELIAKLPPERQEEAADNLEMLVKAADEKKPSRRWYSVSAEGLLEASKFVKDFTGNIAGTIGQLGKLIWPDFSMPKAEDKE